MNADPSRQRTSVLNFDRVLGLSYLNRCGTLTWLTAAGTGNEL